MRLLVVAELPPALASRLTAQRHDALHVFDVALSGSAHAVVWEYELSARLKPSRSTWLQ